MKSEVLIYLQKVKNFIENNSEANDYFLLNSDKEFFFKQLETLATKNMIKNGNPQLTSEQLEFIRRISISLKETPIKKSIEDPLFIEIENFGKICLN